MNDMIQSDETALTVIPATALPTILAADKDDILGKLAAKVAAFKPDISTAKGRDEMRSLAYEIAKAKTSLVKIGKGLTEGWRTSTKAVNTECNTIEERMDELRDKVRGPLTAWENAEKDRVARHEAIISDIQDAARFDGHEVLAEDIQERLEYLNGFGDYNWQEFRERGLATITASIASLTKQRADLAKREAEAAELARLRESEAKRERERQEQERIAREARIAAEAAEKATRDAEAKAAEEAAAAERRAQAERDAAAKRERDAAEALARAERDRQAAEARAKEAEAKAERDRVAAEQKAERDRAAAVEAERRRIEADAEAKRQADEARAANLAHRAAINREALAAICQIIADCGAGTIIADCGAGTIIADDAARAIVVAIAQGKVPHTTINY